MLFRPGFITLVIRLSQSFRSGEGMQHGDVFLLLVEQGVRALPALAASQGILVHNHQNAVVGFPGQPTLGPGTTFTTGLCFI